MMCDWKNYWAFQGPSYPGAYYQPPAAQNCLQPQVDLRSYYDYSAYSNNSSSRQLRNQAEKQRRDKLNTYINELAVIVPMVATSSKKLDKTSILRLSATFLRMHYILIGERGDKIPHLHDVPELWYQHLLEDMDGFLLVATANGKIVFVSSNVEKILGHHQNDLLGTSLLDCTHTGDHNLLKRNLNPVDNYDDNVIVGLDRPDKRSFFIRMRQRAASRSEQPHYELVNVEGHLRNTRQLIKNRVDGGININETVLIALVKPYKERYVFDNSLLEAMREEWITRHLVDGTIVFSDHKISFLSGYLSEEVTGSPAFKYMHKDDVRWVMIALRQMYFKSEGYGASCYRLQSKNGEYIYLRTQGFLETDARGNVQSFICINTLVTPEEGNKAITEMKKRFTPYIDNKELKALTGAATMVNNKDATLSSIPPLRVEVPGELNEAIKTMISDIPPIGISHEVENPLNIKLTSIKKNLPPVEIQAKNIVKTLPTLVGKFNRPSVITSVSATGDRLKRCSQEGTEETEVKRMRVNNSVIVSDTRSHNDSFEVDDSIIFNTDISLDTPGSSFSQFSDDDARLPLEVTTSELWNTSVTELEEEVLREHIHLENSIQSQGVQIQEIEDDLQTVPLAGSHAYQTHFTHLKAEHRKQQELLRTLQQDHHRQQSRDNVNSKGEEKHIGV